MRILPAFVLMMIVAGCSTSGIVSDAVGRQVPASFTRDVTVSTHYLLYLPAAYNGKDRVPLLVFLHGVGERGDSLNLVAKHGPPKLINGGKDFPFIVVSPQCPANVWWNVEALDALLDDVMRTYAVDPDRVYLTGLSMGGFGTWAWAINHPDRFAAIAPVCGIGEPLSVSVLKEMPVWAFHGKKDPVVPLARQQETINALQAAGGKPRFTIYPDAGHDSWTETYDNPELYKWFLEHRKNLPAAKTEP
jgi:predicted peptidase